MQEKLISNGPYANKDFYNFNSTSQLPRHRWYYFKEGFSVNLVTEAIRSSHTTKRKLNILDPFSGSGTTVLTSSLLGHKAVGVEVNPFLEFTAKVKTNSYKQNRASFAKDLNKIVKESIGGAYSPLEGFSTFSPTEDLDKWLFNTSVLRRFTSTLHAIEKSAHPDNVTAFRFVALVAAINCCNARRDGKGLRYKKLWSELNYNASSFEMNFRNVSNLLLDDIEKAPIKAVHKPKVYLSDTRKFLAEKSLNENFDLVVTSPPYLNSFDYTDVYRAELFLGGFVKDNTELRELRLKTLRSHVQVEWDEKIKYESDIVSSYFDKLEKRKEMLWNRRIPIMTKAYFDDMTSILRNVKPRLNRRGQIWLVVSTSAYAGVHIPVDLLIGQIGDELGYKLKGIHWLRNLRTSSQQFVQLKAKKPPLRESLIILEK